ncbi:MAG: hypothetical protein JWR47_254 [Phenylobacterium sp.]|uniref:hypothetical protein n=1 Tax=Phenylobacterium sp. TaxID=1871053 RepID=UPI00261EF361|nr:hypothetical protein [Phenylobacterium sp.]MDB5428289.1 hypothetical protein [Phenylobacterium sp.]MDB5433997.1 hypothetical protein [Phenylobacterium sp.]MDB5462611.1 hypothetical protein [Phenylobacterium sp.]MDB5498623.1 hypothetical protein [Phenylobacterium sp.]
MQPAFAPRRGPILMKTPNHRQQAVRRRLAAICAVLGLALASGLIGSLIHPASQVSSRPTTGPFSYIPAQ